MQFSRKSPDNPGASSHFRPGDAGAFFSQLFLQFCKKKLYKLIRLCDSVFVETARMTPQPGVGQMNNEDRDNARKLAIQYQAYCAAWTEHDRDGQLVWGRMLMNAQRATDVWLIDEQELRATLDWLAEQRAA